MPGTEYGIRAFHRNGPAAELTASQREVFEHRLLLFLRRTETEMGIGLTRFTPSSGDADDPPCDDLLVVRDREEGVT